MKTCFNPSWISSMMYTNNCLSLNIKNTRLENAFTRTRLSNNHNYFMDEETLLRFTGPIKDIGILFDPILKF